MKKTCLKSSPGPLLLLFLISLFQSIDAQNHSLRQLSGTCDPFSCPYLCCDSNDKCANSLSTCYDSFSVSSTSSGTTTKSTSSSSSSGSSNTFYIILIVVILIVLIGGAICLTWKYKRDKAKREAYMRKRQQELQNQGYGNPQGISIADQSHLDMSGAYPDPRMMHGQQSFHGMQISRGPETTFDIFDPYAMSNSPIYSQPMMQQMMQPMQPMQQMQPMQYIQASQGLPINEIAI